MIGNITVHGTIKTKVEVSITDCLEAIADELRFNGDLFVEDDKLYIEVDEGYHKSEFRKYLVTEDKDTVEAFKAFKVLQKYINQKFK